MPIATRTESSRSAACCRPLRRGTTRSRRAPRIRSACRRARSAQPLLYSDKGAIALMVVDDSIEGVVVGFAGIGSDEALTEHSIGELYGIPVRELRWEHGRTFVAA